MKPAFGPQLLCALAALLLAVALQLSSGMYDGRALALATLACAAAVAAALWRRAGPEPVLPVQVVLAAGSLYGLAWHLLGNPTFYGDPRALAGAFRWLALTALVLFSAYLCLHLRASLIKARFLLLLACFVLMGVAVIKASPRPWVDVWVIQQGGAEALRHGVDPYSASYPNIYGALTEKMLAPELLVRGRIAAYPYPPLTALLNAGALVLFGDVRYALLFLMTGAAFLLARAAKSTTGELAALFILFQPRTFFVLEQAWTEPLVLACFAGAALAIASRKSPLIAGAALGLLAASKQTSLFLLLPLGFALPAAGRRKALGIAAVVAALIFIPFALWDPPGFFRGLVRMQLWQPFRDDSLSLSALAAHLRPADYSALSLVGLALAAALFAVCLRGGIDLARAARVAAAAWLLTLLLNKQAFCNYYWLAAGLLCAAAVFPARDER